MYNVYLKLPSKGARLIAVIMALLCCVMALGTGVFAVSSVQTVELRANGSEAQLVMDFPQAAAEEIASMQISLVITPSSGSADIEFVPDSGLPAKIVESRYNSDTDVLTVYLAGTRALFSENSPLTVGKIKIGGRNVSAFVSVKEGSIKFVRGSELLIPSGDVVYPSSVTISTGGVPVKPPSSPTSTTPSSSTQSSTSSAPSSASSSDTSKPDVPVIVPVEPADTSSLADAVDRAGGYKRADYTEDSFGTLTEALNKAKAVLSNTGAAQDEVDEALLVLENAIGMLTPANNAPSGTDGYGSGGDTSSSDSDNSSSSGSSGGSGNSGSSSSLSPEKPSDNSGGESDSKSSGQTVSGEQNHSSQTSDTSTTDSSENEQSGNSTVMWILIVMAVLVVTAAALIAALKLKKK